MLLSARFTAPAWMRGFTNRLVAMRDVDIDRVRPNIPAVPLREAIAPVAGSVRGRAGQRQGRALVAVTAVAITAAVATAAYAWWRRHERHHDDGLHAGTRSWRYGSLVTNDGGPNDWTLPDVGSRVQAGQSSVTVAPGEPPAVEGGEPAVVQQPLAAHRDFGAPPQEPTVMTDEPTPEDDAAETTSNPTDEVPPPYPHAADEDAPAQPQTATRSQTTMRPAGSGATYQAASQPVTQPQFAVPSVRPALPGGWRSPLPQ